MMEIPVLVRSLKSSILSSISSQLGDTFKGVMSAAIEQSRRKANMVAQGDDNSESLQNQKINKNNKLKSLFAPSYFPPKSQQFVKKTTKIYDILTN